MNSIIADNGKEFSYHQKVFQALNCDYYFAHPYCSWERGLNENTNDLLRQYFPKGTDFKLVSEAQVDHALSQLNNRPRKILSFKNPADLMQNKIAALVA